MKKSGRSGFSLVELLVGLGLTALLLQALVPLLSTSFLSYRVSVARTVAHQSARMAMEAMTRDLRLASWISLSAEGESASSLRFQMPGDRKGQTDTLSFQLGLSQGRNARTLYRTCSPGAPTPLTQEVVSELRFVFHSPRSVGISLTVTDPQTGVSDLVEGAVTFANMGQEDAGE